MKSQYALFFMLTTGLFSISACTSVQQVQVRLRDAQTHLPLPAGQYEGDQTRWNPGIPPDPGIQLFTTQYVHGTISDSAFFCDAVPWNAFHIKVKADGHGGNQFSFFTSPWPKPGTIAADWKQATPATKDSRAIEYQIAYPPLAPTVKPAEASTIAH
jgi:hypothetical protein